jgi:hypothetical protein
LWWQIASESALNYAIATMRPAHLAPSDTELVAKLVSGSGLGNKGDSLAQVKVSITYTVDALNLDQIDMIVLISQATSVSQNSTIHMQTWGPTFLLLFVRHNGSIL